jgi:hypothetical protein
VHSLSGTQTDRHCCCCCQITSTFGHG